MLPDTHRTLLVHPERWELIASGLDPESSIGMEERACPSRKRRRGNSALQSGANKDPHDISDGSTSISGKPGRHFALQETSGEPSPERVHWYRRNCWSHSHAELLIGLEGTTVYGLGDRFQLVRPGTVMAFAAMEPHQSGYPPFEPDLAHLWISLMKDHFTARIVRLHQGRMTSSAIGPGVFEWTNPGWLLETSPGHPPPVPSELKAFRLRRLAMDLVLVILEQDTLPATAPDSGNDQRRLIESIQQHLRQTAGRGDSLDSLARIAGYSRFHFLRLFHRETGYTVHTYVDRCRRHRVRELIASGWSRKAIAAELGFATPQSFSRWYRTRG